MDNIRRIDEPDKPSLPLQEVVALQKQVKTVRQVVWSVGVIAIVVLLGLAALNLQLFFLMQVYSYKIDTARGKIHALQRSLAQERKDTASSSGDTRLLSEKVEGISSQIDEVGAQVGELRAIDEIIGEMNTSVANIEKTSVSNADSIKRLIADERTLFQRVDLLRNEVDILKYTDQAKSLE